MNVGWGWQYLNRHSLARCGKEGCIDYLNKLLPLTRPGGPVIAHNINARMADPKYVKAITMAPNLETIVRSGVGLTLKK